MDGATRPPDHTLEGMKQVCYQIDELLLRTRLQLENLARYVKCLEPTGETCPKCGKPTAPARQSIEG